MLPSRHRKLVFSANSIIHFKNSLYWPFGSLGWPLINFNYILTPCYDTSKHWYTFQKHPIWCFLLFKSIHLSQPLPTLFGLWWPFIFFFDLWWVFVLNCHQLMPSRHKKWVFSVNYGSHFKNGLYWPFGSLWLPLIIF